MTEREQAPEDLRRFCEFGGMAGPVAEIITGDTMRALCKYRGRLVIAAIAPSPGGEGKCPECGHDRFREHNGWTECDNDCGFAYLTSDLDKYQQKGGDA